MIFFLPKFRFPFQMVILIYVFILQILKLEENGRTKLFCSAILFQLQNLEKKFRVGGKKLG